MKSADLKRLKLQILLVLKMTKPVIAFVAGLSAPKGRRMGHAGAIVSAFGESAQEKTDILTNAGVTVAKSPSDLGTTVAKVLGITTIAA